ncbi:hypothetical protein OG444_37375 [Streptomyces sp. NBC_01232]|uniref:hypothetical protein n=1 Tax=unclassified Streptomyces TaxID=2593676 RepID=UPI002E1242A3|nr:hypothetical protein OG444_37375 [Streptomyces sp. NBC_01232]
MAELGDPRAAEHLHAVALDTTVDASSRGYAAEAPDALGDTRAAGILDALADGPAQDDGHPGRPGW